jgi:site-specific DNA recombinase
MMEWGRAKRFQVLVVWKLDRLFRDTKLTLQTVDELAELGIEVRSLQEAFTHDANGRFLLTIFAAGAEKERRDIALRMHAGRLASARKGTWIAGGSTPPFGYRHDRTTKRLVIDPEEARIVRLMFRWLVEERMTLFKLQARINEMQIPTKFERIGRRRPSGVPRWWAKRTIGRILSNEVYQGTFTFFKYAKPGSVHVNNNLRPSQEWVTVKTPAIISKSLFTKAQAQLRQNRLNSPRRTNALYLLRGLLVCGYDHRRIQAARRPADRARECKYYFCSGTRKSVSAVRCPSRSVSESRIVPPVWNKLTELLVHPRVVLKELDRFRNQELELSDVTSQIAELRDRKEKVLQRNQRLVELYLSNTVDSKFFRAESLKLKLEVDQIDGEFARLTSLEITEQDMASRARTLQDLYTKYRTKLAGASDEVKRELLMLFINKITVRGEELEICVNLPDPDAFVGQSPQGLSRKATVPIFLHTRLLPVNEIFIKKGVSKNLGQFAVKKSERKP